MPSLLIIGAGGYGSLVKEIAELSNFSTADFLDDINTLAVGKIADLEDLEARYDFSIVAIGNSEVREAIFRRLKHPVSLVHPSAVVSSSASVGLGCVIEANAVVSSESVVKDGAFICAGAVVNHNSVIGEFCQIDCNAVVMSGAEVPMGIKVPSCSCYGKMPEMAREDGNESFL